MCALVDNKYSVLMDSFVAFTGIRSDARESGKVDLSQIDWVFPTTLLPVITFLRCNPGYQCVPPREPQVDCYIGRMLSKGYSADRLGKSYVPIVPLPVNQRELNPLLKQLYVLNSEGRDLGGENAFKLLIGEMVNNIFEHSAFGHAFVMAQKYANKGFVELCFCDDGVGIHGSLKRPVWCLTTT